MEVPRETRRRSAALFGNEKTVEVILALDEEGMATAQIVATRTRLAYSLVRDALKRLSAGGAVQEMPRVGGSRSSLYYQPADGDLWAGLMTAARAVAATAQEAMSRETGTPGSNSD